jgi:aspartate aminotransferase
MPSLSTIATLAPASPIRKLVPFADDAKKRGIKIYHLNIGQPDINSPVKAIEAVRNNKLEHIDYSHSAGILSYRQALAKYYQKHNINVDENEIIVTNAGSEALLFSFFACFNAGDEVIIPEPYYTNYNTFAVYAGVKIIPVKSSIKNGFALPPIGDFEKLLTPKTKAVMICNPGNPTGYLYTKEEIDALGELIKKHDLFLISDEVYREFCYDGATHASAMHLCNKDSAFNEHVILLDSISKRYSACGARVGCLVTKNKELYNNVMKFAQARLSPPTYGQIF